MKLNVPLIRQKKGSGDCGPACLAMILNYYGVKKSIDDLKKEIKVYKTGTYMPQLGAYLIKNGFRAEMIIQNPGLFTIRHRNMSQSGLLKHVRHMQRNVRKKEDKIILKHLVEFMESRGKVTVKIPDANDIKEGLRKKSPVLALLTSVFMTQKNPSFNFHFNVITGLDKNRIYRNDPYWDGNGGKKESSLQDFLFGMYASSYSNMNDGSLLRIEFKTS